jgi:hypothetical protein
MISQASGRQRAIRQHQIEWGSGEQREVSEHTFILNFTTDMPY